MDHRKKILDFNKGILDRLLKINHPLKTSFGIYLFTYRKLYLDGRLFQITSDEAWLDKSPNQGIYLSQGIKPKLIQTLESKSKSFLWSGDQSDPLYQSLLEFNIWNGITFYDFKGDYIEIFAYATEKENTQAANFYLNNMDLLKHFRTFFKDQLDEIFLEKDTKDLFVDIGNHIDLPGIDEQFLQKNVAFLEATQPSYYFLTHNSENIFFTPREAEVLFQLSQGKRTKEIARSMICLRSFHQKDATISPRTVETYLEHIKSKFHNLSRPEIIELFMKSDVYNLMQYKNKVYSLGQYSK